MATIEQTEIDEGQWEEVTPADDPHGYWAMEAPYGRFKSGKPRKTPPGGGGGGTTRIPGKSLSSLKEPLADRMVEYLGPPLAILSPLSVAVLDDRAEKTADALISIAVRRPRVRKMIERFIEGSSTFDLGATVVGLGVAIQVDHGRMEADANLARYFKIPELYRETYGEDPETHHEEEFSPNGLMGDLA